MIEKIAAKYDVPIEPPEAEADVPAAMPEQLPVLVPEAAPWRKFPEVVLLSDYLKANREHGIKIVRRDDHPVLYFNPPLDYSDQDRLAVAQRALELFDDAIGDVYYLMHRGLIPVPDHPGY